MTNFDLRLTPARLDLAAAQLVGQVAADDYVEGRDGFNGTRKIYRPYS